MHDFFGEILEVGDIVAFCAPRYRDLCLGKITSFTAKKVHVEYVNTWNYGKEGMTLDYLAGPKFLIKK